MDAAELEETRVLFIGAWDVIGRRAPKLFAEIKRLKYALIEADHDHALTMETLLKVRLAPRSTP